MQTHCYTYFVIKGNFNPKEISDLLSLKPTKSWGIGDIRRNGNTCYDFAMWEYGRCNEYEVEVELQCLKTISGLKSKVELLRQIKQAHDVEFVLEIVPSIYVNESHPAIGFNKEIIEFCYLTGTSIDIDIYAYDDSNN